MKMKLISLFMKIKLFVAFVIICIPSSYGQQEANYTQYMYNMNVINPAYAGSRGTLSIGMLGRTQWVGIEGAPETLTGSIHAPFGKNVGLGLSVIADKVGPVKETNLYGDFAYTLNLPNQAKWAFGVKTGVSFLDVRQLTYKEPDPNNIPINKTFFNVGVGTFYYTDNYYIGFSVPNLIENRYLATENGTINSAGEKSHFYLTGGYVFEMSDDWKLKPSSLLRAVSSSPLSADFSLNALYINKLEFGGSYRLDESFSGMIGFMVGPGFRIGYAYDYVLNSLGDFNNGSHEIILLYDMVFHPTNIKSPRFF